MKIQIVSNLYPPVVFGGYEILCRQVSAKLEERGHEVRVLTSCFQDEPILPKDNVQRSLDLTTSFPRRGEDVGFVDFRMSTMERVARRNFTITRDVLSQERPDVVFCWCLNRLSLGPVYAAQKARIPVCYTINDEHPRQFRPARPAAGVKHFVKSVSEAWPLRMATFRNLRPFPQTVISQSLKDALLEQGTPIEDAEVIYQGIPLENFPFSPSARQNDEPFRILYAGQLSENKGVHTILEAAARLAADGSRDFEISVLGRGVPEYEQKLRLIAESAGLTDRVHFLGQRPHSEVALHYRRHHAFVFSSMWREPFGLTHLEAMASGCAVISTTRGGCSELIRDGVNALEFEAGNEVQLASRVRLLMEDESLRTLLINGARKWVEERHSLDGYVTRLEGFLRRTIENRG